jgi:hypothetical protein
LWLNACGLTLVAKLFWLGLEPGQIPDKEVRVRPPCDWVQYDLDLCSVSRSRRTATEVPKVLLYSSCGISPRFRISFRVTLRRFFTMARNSQLGKLDAFFSHISPFWEVVGEALLQSYTICEARGSRPRTCVFTMVTSARDICDAMRNLTAAIHEVHLKAQSSI